MNRNNKPYTTESFIQAARQIHGDKYDYSKTVYKTSKDKIIIICPIHGEFEQVAQKHLSGQGCPNCANTKKHTTESFIAKAREVHGDTFDYSKVNYVNNKTKVIITCRKHGDFMTDPHNHLKGKGCPLCRYDKAAQSERKFKTIEEFACEARKIHGDKYDYNKVKLRNVTDKVAIICKKHGEFMQTPYAHLNGQGCPLCSREKMGLARLSNTQEFIEKAKKIHGDKYDYSLVEYIKAKEDVSIICHKKYKDGKEHGVFRQKAEKHLNGCGCPICGNIISYAEKELQDYVVNLMQGTEVVLNTRSVLKSGRELDIYIPSMNLAIEYNGMIWHSELFRDKNYHNDKLAECNEQGIQLIQIYENEFVEHKQIVLDKIRHILGKNTDLSVVYARNTTIKEVDKETADKFLTENHIQGFVSATIYLGAYADNNLVGLMSFKKESDDNDKWELNRFCTDNTIRCIGLGGKLFSHFINNYEFNEIKSFADRRWTINQDNNLYTKLGFKMVEITKPDYRYTRAGEYIHKFQFRKDKLHKKYGLPLEMTESEMAKELGFHKIWNCGLFKYVYKKD